MRTTNFLIGRGELLTYDILAPKRGGKKSEVYSFNDTQNRLLPQIEKTNIDIKALAKESCPRDFAVAQITLNPSYIAKSYFPTALLRSAGLTSVGSRTIKIKPQKWSRKEIPELYPTTEIFVAGKRAAFEKVGNFLESINKDSDEAIDLGHIENISYLSKEEKVRTYGPKDEHFFEICLHMLPDEDSAFIQESFESYAESRGVKIFNDLSFQAGNLWFVPAKGNRNSVESLSEFTFVRVIRPVPSMRSLRPAQQASSVAVNCTLSTDQPLSSDPRVAILDGGLPDNHCIGPWLNNYRKLDVTANDELGGPEHGLATTSAFLFGPIEPNGTTNRPLSYVDHLRVLDDNIHDEDPLELYRTLGFVEQVLLSRQYEFINLSLGPDLPIEDTDVHAWTSVIDDLLSDGNTFMSVAIGNNGEKDKASGNARIQVPSDCVNAVSVGATDSTGNKWKKATYSAIGPGRCPGVIKPDLMAFGGETSQYFHVLMPGKAPLLSPQRGTSFASPYLLRSAVGIRAILGNDVSPLCLKALLVHSADPLKHDRTEVGWGKVPDDIMSIITCPSGVARIVYQGELKPGKYLRAALPLPTGGLKGKVRLAATFCYASPVDPQDAACYTQAGLDITFRPNIKRIKEGKGNADTKGFFDMKKYSTEAERRSDMGKWETVLHNEKRMLGSSLDEPVFDIHYNARDSGGKSKGAEKIRYALVITVEAANHTDIYNEILRAYSNVLTPLQPKVSIPIRV